MRHGLNSDLGFTEADRVENIRRVAEVAKLMVDAGLIVLVSFISPFRAERRHGARAVSPTASSSRCSSIRRSTSVERRDPKGLYRRARAGQIKNFTGIDPPYEPPEAAEISLDTSVLSAEAACERIVGYLRENRYL